MKTELKKAAHKVKQTAKDGSERRVGKAKDTVKKKTDATKDKLNDKWKKTLIYWKRKPGERKSQSGGESQGYKVQGQREINDNVFKK